MHTQSENGNVQQMRSIDMPQINASIHPPAADASLLEGYFAELLLTTLSLSILLSLGGSNE